MAKKYPALTLRELVSRCNAEGLSISISLIPNRPRTYSSKQPNLSKRAKGVLEMAKIDHLEGLTQFTYQELLQFRGCGISTLKEFRKVLREKGLNFKHAPSWDEIVETYYKRK